MSLVNFVHAAHFVPEAALLLFLFRTGSHFAICSFSTALLSAETVQAIRDGGAQDVHLDFHTAPEL